MRVGRLYRQEKARYLENRPRSVEMLKRGRAVMPNGTPMTWMVGLYDHIPMYVREGSGACFTDVDGHRYLDMNHADMSMSCGYGVPAIVDAVSRQVREGTQFLLPHELAIEVSSLLAERFGLPYWQYTLSASQANKECINIARRHTGRTKILTFDGSYHGHIPETLGAHPFVSKPDHTIDSIKVQFNDLKSVEAALGSGDVALVLLEPAMTNISLIKPNKGFLEELRQMTRNFGTLLLADETHTHVCAWGGLTREWSIDPDLVVAGKSIAGGIPMGVYGMTGAVSKTVEANTEFDHWPEDYIGDLALGGTLFGNPLGLAAARAAITQVLTEDGYKRSAGLGKHLADGIDHIIGKHELPWQAFRLFCRSGVCYSDTLPRNALEASAIADFDLNRLQRLFMANRGIWEAIVTAGPAVSFAATKEDVDFYLQVFEELVEAVFTPG